MVLPLLHTCVPKVSADIKHVHSPISHNLAVIQNHQVGLFAAFSDHSHSGIDPRTYDVQRIGPRLTLPLPGQSYRFLVTSRDYVSH